MSRRKQAEEEPEEPLERSAAAGAAVLTVLGTGAVGGIVAASTTAGVLGLWVVGTGALWWSVRHTANPAPPPPPERGCDTKPQFSIVEDRPGHCTVLWQKETSA